MKTLKVSLSSDLPSRFNVLSQLLQDSFGLPVEITNESALDLVLKEKLSWFQGAHVPDLLIADYSKPFGDLKIIADLKKFEKYQWLQVFVIVDENISATREKFLQYGVTEVFSVAAHVEQYRELIGRIASYMPKAVDADFVEAR